ncbi:hypothetical protein M2325_000643 [Methanococcus voltae PS]|uniref:Helicase HerA central domain-containing protein n=1 Tax=Methanococcus voltae PS TaxID=523842 RepID=A0ABT2EYD3_METVO|nr:ATP-binding protein [Methanococcus voltae]MCS3921958.1 hypothetical protein [Methanococcus voltae PS]
MYGELEAEVIAVYPNKILIEIKNLKSPNEANKSLKIGSYLKIYDHNDYCIIAIIENYVIKNNLDNSQCLDEVYGNENEGSVPFGSQEYIIEAFPLGCLDSEGIFSRGTSDIAIPPKKVSTANNKDVQNIYNTIDENERFTFSKLSRSKDITVPVNGNDFFNKHFAVVGSTGSGKSHTVAKILQKAIELKEKGNKKLNNSHILLFDIHSEYRSAFPKCNYLDISKISLPYWLMNSDELESIFIDNSENAYNQIAQFRRAILKNKKKYNPELKDIITYDTPVYFSMSEVKNYIYNKNREVISHANGEFKPKLKDNGQCDPSDILIEDDSRYFEKEFEFVETSTSKGSKAVTGPYFRNFEKFLSRLDIKVKDKRLDFILSSTKNGKVLQTENLVELFKDFLGYNPDNKSNITVIDLSGVPFEVLSITVSIISRLAFDYRYHCKKLSDADANEIEHYNTPLLLVYEEAHKYIPKNSSALYNSCKNAIERIAKEGRKYGVTLALVSQRPSEIDETVFSQCNNYICMRLTNPSDQSYVKNLLPDILTSITSTLPILKSGEALLIGDAAVLPSIVMIEPCSEAPQSMDIKYIQEWKKDWVDVLFENIIQNIKK